MSLDWDLSKIKDHETVCFEEIDGSRCLREETNALIWSVLSVGLTEITEKNADEFFARLHIVEKLNGALRIGPSGQPIYLTAADVQRHIGLVTWVTQPWAPGNETTSQWAKRFITHKNGVLQELKGLYHTQTNPGIALLERDPA